MKRERVPVQVGQLRRDPDPRMCGRVVCVLEVGVPALYWPGEAALVCNVGSLAKSRIRIVRLEKWEVVPC
jgi:hypothetical protein